MFYKLFLLSLAFSCHSALSIENSTGTTKFSANSAFSEIHTYSCIGSKQGKVFTVKATSTEYIILNKKCQSSRTKATSTEYIILLVD